MKVVSFLLMLCTVAYVQGQESGADGGAPAQPIPSPIATKPSPTPWLPSGTSLNQPNRSLGGKVSQRTMRGLLVVSNEGKDKEYWFWLTGLDAAEGMAISGRGQYSGRKAVTDESGKARTVDVYAWTGESVK